MSSSTQEQAIKATDELLKPELDEWARRLWVATEARSLGHGGVTTAARATGLGERTIRLGKKALTSRSTASDAPRPLRRQRAKLRNLVPMGNQGRGQSLIVRRHAELAVAGWPRVVPGVPHLQPCAHDPGGRDAIPGVTYAHAE
jgi:hypothetical protein